tara:strand:- start:842 stop:2248 length:1407 start_codon:yes stop_codon:yes gene_type:complete
MKKLILILCIPFFGIAQTDYELAFNSATQDYVEMTNASSLIANATTFSMSGWVYPQATSTSHSGIMGFRNNLDSDFYLLQLQNSNNVEARFRNSGGVKFDVLANNLLDFNQWQHLAFTYDGTYIRLYKNGNLVDSTAANGTITQTTQSFNLGMLDYQGSAFHFNGRLDEIRLWDVALSQTEINSWMCAPIDLTHPNYNNLMGYWRLNAGLGTIVDDQTANGNNGTLIGGAQWQTTTNCTATSVQIYGCTDPLACNYNLLANINDSSCVYLDIITFITSVSCNGGFDGSIVATATGGTFPFQYSLGAGLSQASGTFSSLSVGSYYIDVTDMTGCTSSQMVTITEPPALNISVDSTDETSALNDGSATASVFGGISPYAYAWSNGGTTNPQVNLAPGLYTVIVTDAAGCTISDSTSVSPYFTTGAVNIKNTSKTLIKITDMLGQETPYRRNAPFFYIYDDGTVKKQIIIE